MRRLAAPFVALAILAAAALPARAEPVVVFAAASLVNAFEEIGRAWVAQGHRAPKFSFAASSTLAKQIEQDAPAAIFASADEAWMDYLVSRGRIDVASRADLAGNRLVLVVPADRPATVELGTSTDFAALLRGGRIATGDPAHVPVGRYAEQALRSLGGWDAMAPRLVRADSVRAALALVERGEVAGGIVYSTDAAISTRVKVAGVFPARTHKAIVYPIAAVAGRTDGETRALLAFLTGGEARAILGRYGFSDPGVQ